MNIDERKAQIITNVKWDIKHPNDMGGQQVGALTYPVILMSEDFDIEITVGFYKSILKNKELAIKLFSIALDNIMK